MKFIKNKEGVNITQTIKLSGDTFDFPISMPESIKIIRNPIDDTYNLYALMFAKYNLNGDSVVQLASMKSEKLRLKKDLNFDITFSSEDNYSYATANGVKLIPFLISSNREFLYNLTLAKSTDVLCEFSVLNKGDGLMNYNIYDGLEAYTVQIDVAGFTKDELSVVRDEELIKVKAIPQNNMAVEDSECIRKGITKNRSQCEIFLPNTDSIEAEHKDGILVLTISKKRKGTKVEIK